jgi:tetratricopeptide (TPR) repeat protein
MAKTKSLYIAIICFLSFLILFSSPCFAETDKEKRRRKIMEKMERLQREKQKIKKKEKSKISKIQSRSKANRAESIKLFERIVASTKKGDPRRCDAYYQLGSLYYDDERDTYIEKQNRFQKLYAIWEKSGSVGAPPVEPMPTYKRATNAYKNLVLECPTYKTRDIALYKLGNIFTALGDFEGAFESFNALIKDYPKSENVPYAHLRVGEYHYMNRDNKAALKHYKAVGMKSGANNYMLALYRVASCYYNMAQFEKAIDKFFEYVELAASDKYKADFKEEALEFLAISFSEMEGGAESAMKFFEKKGGRPYQNIIIYTIGIKNRDHDNIREAIKSLDFLLEHYPLFIEAPIALKALTDCYVIEKEYGKANRLRERMIKEYGPGSKWWSTHSGESERADKVKTYIKEAGSIIPLYYHKLAVTQKDSNHAERARGLMEKALVWYKQYIQKFPGEKWNAYTFHYYVADILSDDLMGRYGEAAREFDWVSRQDTTTFPSRVKDAGKALEEKRKKTRDIRKQFDSDIKEKVATIQINPEEAGFAAVVCKRKVVDRALKARGLDSTSAQGADIPEMHDYLNYIKDFMSRFPMSKHAEEVAFLKANIHFDDGDYREAIDNYKRIVDNPRQDSKVQKASLENLAKAYLKNQQYEMAISTFKRLLHEYSTTTQDKQKMIESIAAAMFQIAGTKQKQGDYTGAADYFKRIVIDYPDFSKCDISLYNGANSYEEGRMYREAAREFERVFDKFPKSKLRKKALLRAAAAYQKAGEYPFAAKIFLKYSSELPTDRDAVPCIFRAAFMYDSAGDFNRSAQTYERIYDEAYKDNKRDKAMYVTADKEAPNALYSAGYIYEKAKLYSEAIVAYRKLEKAFPNSRATADAVFSIAICYEKLSNDKMVAESYLEYTRKYGGDKKKVVESLMKAAKAYKRLNNKPEEEKIYRTIIAVQKKYGKTEVIDEKYAAEAYFILGERAFEEYAKLDLRTSKKRAKDAKKEIATKLKKKSDAIKMPLSYFTECIALATDRWTTHATYMCGEIFWNLMETVKNQPILEKNPDKIAYAKVKVNEALPPYFEKAMGYYFINVDKFGNKEGVRNRWVELSAEKYAQCWYQLCYSNVENGQIFSAAPNPFPKGTQEYDEYQLQISSVVKKLIEKCKPCLADGITNCNNAYISNSWVERMKKELEHQDPGNAALKIAVKEAPKRVVKRKKVSTKFADDALKRAQKRIREISGSGGMPIEEKIAKLRNLEMGAKREIDRVNEAIRVLKENL